ncbi:MAG: CarD family transcriptional regulator [Lachnospiraceae bacterium]|nr:CarD family transcriptional regulator [Lachnospiraceae bacterium]
MFQKKDIIYSETLGVCRVEDITKLSHNKGNVPTPYYFLRSVTNKAKIAYIPVEHHAVLLRELITLEEAETLKQDSENAEQELPELRQQEMEYVLQCNGEKIS